MKNYKDIKVGETFLIVEMSTKKHRNLNEFRIVLDDAYERSTRHTSYYIMTFHFEDRPNIGVYAFMEEDSPGFEQPFLLHPNNRYALSDEDKEIADTRCGTGYMLGYADDAPGIVSRCKAFLMESLKEWREKINAQQQKLNKREDIYKDQIAWLCSKHDIRAVAKPPEKK